MFAPVIAVIVMASVLFANVPYAAYKEVRIIKLPALRALNNMLRHDAENLEAEVTILTEEIDNLQPEAARYVRLLILSILLSHFLMRFSYHPSLAS